ncbi:bifunctional lysylphosphatidylglycerol flippase/synthetase MprF [Candidatus Poribacteria bacterium]|nr:bifunctional lysylphosphatidylglycerol flippase/synthetase MprF [Candidatus Poribacteria bacterium]
MKRKLLRMVGPLVSVILFALVLWVLHRELREYHFHDLANSFRQIPARQLFLAAALTVLSYLIMTGYDALALRYIQRPLSYGKIALVSFIAYAFGNNLGFSMIAGGSVRYRFYSAWGLSAFEITKVVVFCTVTFWLGFLLLTGSVFLVEPLAIPRALHIPFVSVHPIGVAFLVLTAIPVVWAALGRKPVRIRDWEFSPPPLTLLLAQITISLLDWLLACAVFYALLPPAAHLTFPHLAGIYMLAQAAGIVSQVPGGLGVFETAILALLSRSVQVSDILGPLLAYRGLYYLLPLITASVLLAGQEVLRGRKSVEWAARIVGEQVSSVVPSVLAFTTFVGGAILLFSGATPVVGWRQMWLKDFVPLPAMEISHLLGSVAGMGLLILAQGLQRRLDAAYIVTVIFLICGIFFSLFKGLDYEEAIALSVMLIALAPCRRHFYRKASLLAERFNPGWVVAIVIVLLASIWLGIFSYKHVEYTSDLWWHFTFSGSAPRFLRATVGAFTLALFFAFAKLLRPAAPQPAPPDPQVLEKAAEIARQSPATLANLALLGDKSFLFSDKETAFIMYGVEGRSWVALGDPVGPPQEAAELTWKFREMCDRHAGWTVFYEVSQEDIPIYLDLGLTLLKLGEEARVQLETFSLEGGGRKGMRHIKNKLEKEGCSFEVISSDRVSSLLPEFKSISGAWLAEKNTREKGFSLGFFDEGYLKRFPAAVVRKEGKVVAFANVWQGAANEELSIDLMRYLPEATHDSMEYLFINLMLWGKEQGYHWFNLGMAPLSGLEGRKLGPLWNRVGTLVFQHGEHFYNFQGLRQYKEKFDPEWRPRYLASPGGLALPLILANLATLISRGFKGAVTK